MEVVLASRVEVRGVNPGDPAHAAAIDRLRERFDRENPVYWDARRFRRPCRHIVRRIELIDGPDAGGVVRGPRGAWKEVVGCLGDLVDAPVREATAFPEALHLALTGELRDYQAAAVEAAVREAGGVIQAPTGSGKTVVAMGLVARLRTPALIVVHTSVLLEQTAARVRQFLGVEPALVGGGHDSPGQADCLSGGPGGDVTIAMVQTLMRRDLAPWRDRFGLVVLDEAHHCPAETFKSVVQAFAARYRVGLTATPNRKDRLHPVLYDVVGPLVHVVAPKTLVATGSIARVEVIHVETEFRGAFRNNYGRLINRVAADPGRNALLVEKIRQLHAGRSLVLSERVDHCRMLADRLAEAGVKAVAMTGETPREAREDLLRRFASGDVEALVSTTALVGEGFDLPAIDTVFLTIPNGNVAKTTQALGRALRPHEGKAAGRIVDFVDSRVSLLRNQFNRRLRVYQRFR
ncbi:MAG: DEAD/DEAH box helicase [Deltaproteobacteria bacterium]|nr:DEAD/DEAH box helicase [Deltaproteobacteria bacterium]